MQHFKDLEDRLIILHTRLLIACSQVVVVVVVVVSRRVGIATNNKRATLFILMISMERVLNPNTVRYIDPVLHAAPVDKYAPSW
jgi:glycerol-3-phosphate cytidylyltransferase-like family protein